MVLWFSHGLWMPQKPSPPRAAVWRAWAAPRAARRRSARRAPPRAPRSPASAGGLGKNTHSKLYVHAYINKSIYIYIYSKICVWELNNHKPYCWWNWRLSKNGSGVKRKGFLETIGLSGSWQSVWTNQMFRYKTMRISIFSWVLLIPRNPKQQKWLRISKYPTYWLIHGSKV